MNETQLPHFYSQLQYCLNGHPIPHMSKSYDPYNFQFDTASKIAKSKRNVVYTFKRIGNFWKFLFEFTILLVNFKLINTQFLNIASMK